MGSSVTTPTSRIQLNCVFSLCQASTKRYSSRLENQVVSTSLLEWHNGWMDEVSRSLVVVGRCDYRREPDGHLFSLTSIGRALFLGGDKNLQDTAPPCLYLGMQILYSTSCIGPCKPKDLIWSRPDTRYSCSNLHPM